MKDDGFVDEILECIGELKKGRENTRVNPPAFKLGEVVANGVKYFGQEKVTKGIRSAMFVCPLCEELWRANFFNVIKGRISHCGCKNG